MDLFEQALRRRADQEQVARILVAQWDFDRRLVAQALQSVQTLFGHYSRHDETHSNTILIQIARLLGPDRIGRLSATDLWLLLEAAYQHDIGMVVPDVDSRKWWASSDFRDHLDSLRDHPDPDYRTAADVLLGRSGLDTLGTEWPFEVKRHLTLVLADYGRRKHPARAEMIVRSPETIGLASPRVLLPERLWGLLGRICALHGSNFNETLKLHRIEQGIGTDDAHPLFVACMLRLGDLLDLDNGRFCPVMKACFGVLPSSSAAHERKHASIRHLHVNPSRIEIEAVCQDEESFDEAERWLSWVRDEVRDLSARWADVSPESDFGGLPALGTIEAHLADHVLLENGRRPRFEVDRESLLTLVRGGNLYSDRSACIRELLQNAVDATLLRVWDEQRERLEAADAGSATGANPLAQLREIVASYPIDVKVERVSQATGAIAQQPPSDSPGTLSKWRITIADVGMGISRKDLEHIQRIGGSQRNPHKRRARREMPEWLRPSGIFGIGLQSVFLITDRAELLSRALDSNEVLEVVLRRGDHGNADGLLVKPSSDRDLRRHGGTRVSFEFEVEAVPSRVSLSTSDEDLNRILTGFDPVADQDMPYEAARIRAAVRDFAFSAAVPVRLDGTFCEMPPVNQVDDDRTYIFFDRKTSIELRFRGSFHGSLTLCYRGAPLETVRGSNFINLQADLRFGEARDLLQLSREKLSGKGVVLVGDRLDDALSRAMPAYLEHIKTRGDADLDLQAASLWSVLADKRDLNEIGQRLNSWREHRLWETGPKLGELLDATALDVVVDGARRNYAAEPNKWNPREGKLELLSRTSLDPETLFALFSRMGRHVSLASGKMKAVKGLPGAGESTVHYRVSRDSSLDPLPDGGLKYLLLHRYGSWGVGGRVSLPCSQRFAELALRERATWGTWINRTHSGAGPLMVSPFFVEGNRGQGRLTLRNVTQLIRWVAERVLHPAPVEQIARAYLRFIVHADRLARVGWGERVNYEIDEVRHELRREFGIESDETIASHGQVAKDAPDDRVREGLGTAKSDETKVGASRKSARKKERRKNRART
ncbi:MAG: hypothetical protein EPO40_27805 [Myxococcaceae bacterium]|nr:MAG: hypothetical protein EPO40_27805 [Myxococcaceae bacterium]